MTSPTQVSLHEFIATAPTLNFTGSGHARCCARIGVDQRRKEEVPALSRSRRH